MKKFWKRNAVLGSVLVLVCAAIALNGRYAQEVAQTEKVLGQSTFVDGVESGEAAEVLGGSDSVSDYFASARLTRQQARDSAISLLEEAKTAEDSAAANEAAKSIQVLASYTLAEAQIENIVTAKGYEDCVVFMSDDGVSVVVAAKEDGLQTEDVAKITDIVKQETNLSAEQIKILEAN